MCNVLGLPDAGHMNTTTGGFRRLDQFGRCLKRHAIMALCEGSELARCNLQYPPTRCAGNDFRRRRDTLPACIRWRRSVIERDRARAKCFGFIGKRTDPLDTSRSAGVPQFRRIEWIEPQRLTGQKTTQKRIARTGRVDDVLRSVGGNPALPAFIREKRTPSPIREHDGRGTEFRAQLTDDLLQFGNLRKEFASCCRGRLQ